MEHATPLQWAQLTASVLTIAVMVFGIWKGSFILGRFAEKMEGGLLGIREDLNQHTTQEEKRFEYIDRSLSDLKVGQATHGTRLQHLERINPT